MVYKEIEKLDINTNYKDCIITYGLKSNCQILQTRSRYDFTVKDEFIIGKGVYTKKFFDDRVILFTNKSSLYKVFYFDKNVLKTYSEELVHLTKGDDHEILLAKDNSRYYITDHNNIVDTYQYPKGLGDILFFKGDIIEVYNKDKANNFIRRFNPLNKKESWVINFDCKINKIRKISKILLIDYWIYESNPIKSYTIAVDIENGVEIWNRPYGYNNIDYANGVALSGGETIHEIDINSGVVINCVKVSPPSLGGYVIYFSNELGYYYKLYSGGFGLIDRKNGNIRWEYIFEDNSGNMHGISQFAVLSNNKVVLKTMDVNGPMCIFDPMANLKYSNIKKGTRIEN
jgi:hypothetical protein